MQCVHLTQSKLLQPLYNSSLTLWLYLIPQVGISIWLLITLGLMLYVCTVFILITALETLVASAILLNRGRELRTDPWKTNGGSFYYLGQGCDL
eukprot:5395935-Ditylum_brightwellii.AAC.1